MIAVLVVALWTLWAVHLAVVVLDVIALLRGLVPRVGLVRLVWVLAAGGATATTAQTAALAAHTHTATAVPVLPDPTGQETEGSEDQPTDRSKGAIDRVRHLPYFGFDSAELTPEMEESLQPTIDLISDFGRAEGPVVVTGHTDPVGDPAYNRNLSEQRAQAVADYLAQHLEETDFEVRGAGSTQPPANPQAPYGEHRRVEIAYTVQPLPDKEEEPAPTIQPDAENTSNGVSEPERVRLDVTTASDQAPEPDPLLVGAVAGAVGLGAGYAAGRRRASRLRESPAAPAPIPAPAPAVASTADTTPATGDLLTEDRLGLARGAIDEDGYVLVSDTVRVNGRDGVAFVGAHSAAVLAAVATDHAPGPVISTRAAFAALGGVKALPKSVQVVPDLPGARNAVESELLTATRRRMEEADGAPEDDHTAGTSRILVVCDAGDLDAAHGWPEASDDATVVVCVLGETDRAAVALDCDVTDRVRARSAHAEACRDGAVLRRHSVSEHSASSEAAPLPVEEEADPAVPATLPPVPAAPDTAEDAVSCRVRLRLFAPTLVIQVDGREVTGLRSVARALLAYLALRPRGASAEDIAQECFAALDPARAVSARKNAINSIRSSLRKALQEPEQPVLANRSGRYTLDSALFSVDLWDFSRSYKESRPLEGGPRQQALEDLVRMHPVKLLAGSEEVWAQTARKSCVRAVVASLLELAENAPEEEVKIRFLEQACLFDEFNEPLYQRIMAIHVSRGRPEIAHQVYRSLKEKLSLISEKPCKASRAMVESSKHPAR
ncbi:OmpA family protein [Nocardiopsis sp. FR6]|uniref:OmpA family protein n=1 Tax=Nocardiopsis sp. FR6 TaxID=2605986 RepID=UPI001357F7B0|nr:OmpA family protein [Nocardiopsis sp. FR6]